MLHGVVSAKVNGLVVRSWGGVVDPLSPVSIDLLGGTDVNNKGVWVPGLGCEPRVEEQVVNPVPTMVLQMRPRFELADEGASGRHRRCVGHEAEGGIP